MFIHDMTLTVAHQEVAGGEEWQGAVNFHADNMSKADRHKGIKNAQIQLPYNAWDRDMK